MLNREDTEKINKVLTRLKRETGHEWFPLNGIFAMEPYQSGFGTYPAYTTWNEMLSNSNSSAYSGFPLGPMNQGKVLVKLFASTKTSEIRTILAQSVMDDSH